MLLQRRSASKYHSAGLWSNACCSHPRPGESAAAAARRRLEEMGFFVPLGFAGLFSYQARVGYELWENETVNVFAGFHDGDIAPALNEVQDFQWRTVEAVRDDLAECPEHYTAWSGLYSRGVVVRKIGSVLRASLRVNGSFIEH
jgi:isopentenyl-diphosphate Delta-isomerase